MKYRILGKTGLRVSVVGIGTWQLGGEWGKTFVQSEVSAILGKARDGGINLIDTAECYGDHLAEKLVGRAIRCDRPKWVVATKFGHLFRRRFERQRSYEPEAVVRQLEASLRALRTDYVDLYQFHSGDDVVFDTDGLWDTLQRQVELGKILHLGISVKRGDDLYQVSKASSVNAGAVQVIYNRLDRLPEQGLFDLCQDQNLGVLARVPLASGLLSGKYRVGATFPEQDVRERWYKEGRDELLARVERIKREEVPAGMRMAPWALAWCLGHPNVTSVIPGCKSVEQVESNATAARLNTRFRPFGGVL